MSGHTPGPWRFNPTVEHAGTVSADAVGLRVALICSPPTGRTGETDANARLIAAAPELLAALVDLVDWFSDGETAGGFLDEANAAIAKATLP